MNGYVERIFICPVAGAPMQAVFRVRVIAGVGLEGDRYATGKGAYSKSVRRTVRHVSLISTQAIEEANRGLSEPFEPHETRRNILTSGIDLNALVGKEFRIGAIRMRGVELCEPCDRPSMLAKKPGFRTAFENLGGLRAEIIESGVISPRDDIVLAPS